MFCSLRKNSYFCAKSKALAKNGISKNSEYIRFDWALKRILRDKANFEVLDGLVSVLLKQKITITGIAESEANKDRRKDKAFSKALSEVRKNGKIKIVHGMKSDGLPTETISKYTGLSAEEIAVL